MDSDCTCHSPGYCGQHNRDVTPLGAKIWKRGDKRSIAAYFDGGGTNRVKPRPAVPKAERTGPCAYLGGPVMGDDGKQLLKLCPTCTGTVRLKVFECGHLGHASDPTTTDKACKVCPDYSREVVQIGDATLNFWRGGS